MTRIVAPPERLHHGIPLWGMLALWTALAGLSHLRYQPPPVIPADALSSRFSAERAEPIYQRLYQQATPHPAGENAAFRQQVIDEFRGLGFEVELHQTSDTPRNQRSTQSSVPLVNLIVRLVGKTDKPPVMLCAHYDSVPYGPGAADDGVGLTTLIEIARMLRDEPPLERTIIFLVTDGEELGLLGARRFVEEHALADRVAAVINLEARGTNGPSILFETSPDSGWLIGLFARTSRRPFASSLFFEIYRLLPNNTDFTVFRMHGIRGFNFAFIGDVKNYHTPQDNFETVDRRSLQHHGENALPLLRALAEADIESHSPTAAAVYFDLYGLLIVRWPSWLSIGFSVAGLVLVLTFRRWRASREPPANETPHNTAKLWISVMLVPAAILLAMLLGKTLDFGLRLDAALDTNWPDQPVPIQSSFWLLGLAGLLALAWLASPRLNWSSLWFAVWLVWSVLALTTAVLIPGASYLFIVPLLGTSLAILMVFFVGESHLQRQAVFVSCCGVLSVGLIWMPIERIFYDAVGFGMNTVLIVRVAIAWTALLPVMALTSRRVLGFSAAAVLLIWTGAVLWGVVGN